MLIATNKKSTIEIESTEQGTDLIESASPMNEHRLSSSGLIVSKRGISRIARLVYFLNATIVLLGILYITVKQHVASFRCTSITVVFDEVISEDANVLLDDGSIDQRLLVYSFFNGVYIGEILFMGDAIAHFNWRA